MGEKSRVALSVLSRLVACLLLVAACSTPLTPTPTTSEIEHPFPVASIEVGDTELTVWVADTPANRQQGLMEVEELPAGIDGMLFVFDAARNAEFWMLNTLMSLDIWWFGPEGDLLGSTLMQPCERQPCDTYPSPGPVLHALETPAGKFDFDQGSNLTIR